MNFAAHIRKDGVEQSVQEHMNNVAEYAGIVAGKIGLKHCGMLAAKLHDLGKYTKAFDQYIRSVYLLDKSNKKGPDHSTAGAVYLMNLPGINHDIWSNLTAQILALTILGHHGGLGDIIDELGETKYLKRLRKIKTDEIWRRTYVEAGTNFEKENEPAELVDLFQQAVAEVKTLLTTHKFKSNRYYIMGLLCKYLYSCLIDADRYDTATFMDGAVMEGSPNNEALWLRLGRVFEEQMNSFSTASKINKLRQEISDHCIARADCPAGIYTLNCPTGSGKTLASFRWALEHAKRKKKQRIFYIVPFLAVLDQNVEAIKNMLPGENLDLIIDEIHSGKEEEFEETIQGEEKVLIDEVAKHRAELITERMEAPIIFTTMVRFLNTFFAHGTKNLRAAHNFTDAIIIFDEIQTINPKCIGIFNGLTEFLTKVCHATILLSTATQPCLNDIPRVDKLNEKTKEIVRSLELAPNSEISGCDQKMHDCFKRTEFIDLAETKGLSVEKISELVWEKAKTEGNSLVIFNTKKSVQTLYLHMKELYEKEWQEQGFQVYVLTTNIYPHERKRRIAEIKEKLLAHAKIIVISTQLIEAGVDVSFQNVVRSLAGLDSLIQSAGRCNRHGDNEDGHYGQVYLINPDFENIGSLQDIKLGKEATELLLRAEPAYYDGDLGSLKAIHNYFRQYLFSQDNNMRYKIHTDVRDFTIYELLSENNSLKLDFEKNHSGDADGMEKQLVLHQSFALAAKYFAAIDEYGTSVVVNVGEGAELIRKLLATQNFAQRKRYLQKLGQYTVNIAPILLKKLELKKAITLYAEFNLYVLDESCYDEVFGVTEEGDTQKILMC